MVDPLEHKVRKRRKHTFWSMYVVRCSDGSLYAGVTTDVKRRVAEHNTSYRGSKYTRSRRPVSLVLQRRCQSKSEALINEHAFKKMTKPEKEAFIEAFQEL